MVIFYAMKASTLKANVQTHAIGCPDLDKSYADVPTGKASLSFCYLCWGVLDTLLKNSRTVYPFDLDSGLL